MDLKLNDIEANAVVHALNCYLKTLDKSSTEKGMTLEVKTVEALLERIASMTSAPGT